MNRYQGERTAAQLRGHRARAQRELDEVAGIRRETARAPGSRARRDGKGKDPGPPVARLNAEELTADDLNAQGRLFT